MSKIKRMELMETNMERLEREIGALQYDLIQAVSVAEQEEIERKIETLQAEYRMILNAFEL